MTPSGHRTYSSTHLSVQWSFELIELQWEQPFEGLVEGLFPSVEHPLCLAVVQQRVHRPRAQEFVDGQAGPAPAAEDTLVP